MLTSLASYSFIFIKNLLIYKLNLPAFTLHPLFPLANNTNDKLKTDRQNLLWAPTTTTFSSTTDPRQAGTTAGCKLQGRGEGGGKREDGTVVETRREREELCDAKSVRIVFS